MIKVSIILPVYNGERYIAGAIESILCQTFSSFELIVIDDGSTDKSVDIIKTYKDGRIILLQNPVNLGIVESLNKGIRQAIGAYIGRMDADDISVETRLEKQIEYLEKNKDVAVVGSQVILMDENGNDIGSDKYPVSPEDIRKSIFIHNPVAHGAALIRSSVLKECGLYDPLYIHNEDYDLWLRICSKYLLANLPLQLLKRRIHRDSITVTKKIDMVKFRLKTLQHAVASYYHNPFLNIYLLRPLLAVGYHMVRKSIKK